MNIVSWNVYRDNKHTARAITFLTQLSFDIACLQEVTEDFLRELRHSFGQCAYAVEIVRSVHGNIEHNYSVIVSRFPIVASGRVDFGPDPKTLRTFLTHQALRPLGWVSSSEHGALYADIDYGGERIRVFSLHLSLTGATQRREQLERVMQHLGDGPNIIAGDFNITNGPLGKLLGWLLGGSFSDLFFDERKRVEAFFKERGFHNPHYGMPTHDFSKTQLDHILVPRDARTTSVEVLKDSHGSDHNPIRVEVYIGK